MSQVQTIGADADLLQREPLGSDFLLDAVERLLDAGCEVMVDAELERRETGESGSVWLKTHGWIGPTDTGWRYEESCDPTRRRSTDCPYKAYDGNPVRVFS